MSNVAMQSIEEFINSYEGYSTLPNKNTCNNGMAVRQLKKSLKYLNALYRFKTGSTVSLSSLKRYKSKYFISVTKAKIQHCLCKYCTNPMDQITAIIGFCILHNILVQMPDDIDDLFTATMCSTLMKSCRERQCGGGSA